MDDFLEIPMMGPSAIDLLFKELQTEMPGLDEITRSILLVSANRMNIRTYLWYLEEVLRGLVATEEKCVRERLAALSAKNESGRTTVIRATLERLDNRELHALFTAEAIERRIVVAKRILREREVCSYKKESRTEPTAVKHQYFRSAQSTGPIPRKEGVLVYLMRKLWAGMRFIKLAVALKCGH